MDFFFSKDFRVSVDTIRCGSIMALHVDIFVIVRRLSCEFVI